MENSTLIKLAKTANVRGQSRLTWLYEPIVFVYSIVSLLIVSTIFGIPVLIYMFATYGEQTLELIEAPPTPGLALALLFSSFIGIYLAVWLWVRFIERRSYFTIGLQRKRAVWMYIRGLLIGVGLMMLNVGILALLGMIDWQRPFTGLTGTVLAGIGMLLLGFIVQGAAEEVLVRGFLLPILARKYSIWASIAVTSTIFAALHLLNPNLSAIAVLNLFLAGVFFAVYALKEGSIWGACGAHTTWNWTMGHLVGFEVSGQLMGGPDAILFDLVETGPDWITGGPFGLEGGVVVTAVIILGTVICYLAPTNTEDV
ncbi:MAG: CPBP family intramembrane glutamic endopeptidase [Chloroflexota bacterium]